MSVQPALTPEEWREDVPATRDTMTIVHGDVYFAGLRVHHTDRHGLAAICLYGQPFGFTREDVQMLRFLCDKAPYDEEDARLERALLSLADRIEALLPPEDGS